jgi:hypothetical protein
MVRLRVRCFIGAPREAVWDVLADLERQGEWMVDVRRLAIVSDARRGVGTVLHVTSELFGLPLVRDVMEITHWEPPTRMDVAHRGQFHGTGSFQLDSVANGTIFVWTEDVAPPLGRIGEVAFALAVRPHLTRVFRRSMANVARLASARAATRGA